MEDMIYTNLKQETKDYIDSFGFREFTTIQTKAIPLILKGRDVIGLSETGTGKTHAYLIPILNRINTSDNRTQAVILAPTRELARQIYENAREFSKFDENARIRLISSEMSKEKMGETLKNVPHVVIGTPGRMKDAFINEGTLRLDKADILVVDEADMTVEFGFINDVDAIAGHMKEKLQILAFSATMPQALKIFLEKYMHDPARVFVKNDATYYAKVTHKLVPARHKGYLDCLLRILPGFHPYICLIFANSREEADTVSASLREHGYTVLEIHGGLTQRERKSAMKRIQNLDAQYIVATDIAARGIDIPGVSHVVSLGFPKAIEYYIHRAGRTGRIKSDGVCYAIYEADDDASIRELMKRGIKFEHTDYRQGEWKELKAYGVRRKKPENAVSAEINKIAKKPVKQVKPGYKKKRAAAIEKVKRKHRREMIESNIKALSKEKNRLKQRQKNIESGKYD